MDFRRFQVDLNEPIAMDDPRSITQLQAYGEEMGKMLLNDQVDRAMGILPNPAPSQGAYW